MKNIDLRLITPEARTELRRVVIRLYKKNQSKKAIAEELGIRRMTVISWIKKYEQTGKISNQEQIKGRRSGTGRTLSPEQELSIQTLIVDKTPDQLDFPFALWSNKAVKALILQQFGLEMPVRTVCLYLSRWGFTPQRPLKRAYEQQPKQVKEFLDNTYPAIKLQAKKEQGEIHWADETGISSLEHYPRGYAPKGKTPVLTLSNASRERVNMISSITNQGKVRFMIYNNKFTAKVFIKFIRQLTKNATKKVFLILDNLRVHHAKLVKDYLKGKEDKIELFFLPSYSPELNPDEYLNCDLKAKINTDKAGKKERRNESKNVKAYEVNSKTTSTSSFVF